MGRLDKSQMLSQRHLEQVADYLQKQVDEGRAAGVVSLIAQGGEIQQALAVGMADVDSGRAMTADTIFRIYSLTKTVTSVAVMMLHEEGHFWLEEPIASFIPALGNLKVFVDKTPAGIQTEEPGRDVTIHDLLTHTAGIGMDALFGSPLASAYREAKLTAPERTLADMMEKLGELPLLNHPGEAWRYSISPDVLARLVEVVSGMRFDEFLRERIFAPLGMDDTGFLVPADRLNRLATVYRTDRPGELIPVDEAETSPYGQQQSFLSGSAGLVSTPLDFYRFAQMLLGKGIWRDVRLLRTETVELMTRNHLPNMLLPYQLPWHHLGFYTQGCGFGLGFRVVLDVEAWGVPGSEGEYGWGGATNTFMWVDPTQDLVLLLFMQSIPFLHWPIDREYKALVYQGLDV